MEAYLVNLQERDKREQINASIIDSYDLLAQHFIQTTQASSSLQTPIPSTLPPEHNQSSAPSATPTAATATVTPADTTTTAATTTSTIAQLRQDLATAQTARVALEARLSAHSTLQRQAALATRQVEMQGREIAALTRRIADRDAELVEGKRVVQEAHDEMVSLNLQLNVAEDKVRRVEEENRSLVARWMEAKREEVERMNEKHQW